MALLPGRTMLAVFALAALLACGGSCGGDDDAADTPDGGSPGPDAPAPTADAGPPVDPLLGIGAVEPIQGGFMFLEGPQWRVAEQDLLFTDIPANTIYRLQPPSTITPFRTPSDNANGLAVDPDGLLLAAEHGARRVSRALAGGAVVTVVDSFEGKKLNSPNDIAVRADGTLYFTDPPYGIAPNQRELDFMGIFRVAPGAGGALTAEEKLPLSARPNGIVLSPDQTRLYVDDSGTGAVQVFEVAPDGSLGPATPFVQSAGGSDGMAIDAAGNLYVTSTDGVEVFAPDGSRWGAIAFAEKPANCAFGDADLRTLYVTAQTTLYRVRLASPGVP